MLNDFLDEYKHLEKLCNEIYGENHGVTLYISDMEQTPSFIQSKIPGWNEDYKRLKKLRYIRNVIVHEDSALGEYTEDDVHYLKLFYQKIIDGEDPLSKRRALQEIRNNNLRNEESIVYWPPANSIPRVNDRKEDVKESEWKYVGIALILGVIILAVLFSFFSFVS